MAGRRWLQVWSRGWWSGLPSQGFSAPAGEDGPAAAPLWGGQSLGGGQRHPEPSVLVCRGGWQSLVLLPLCQVPTPRPHPSLCSPCRSAVLPMTPVSPERAWRGRRRMGRRWRGTGAAGRSVTSRGTLSGQVRAGVCMCVRRHLHHDDGSWGKSCTALGVWVSRWDREGAGQQEASPPG